VTVLDIKHKKTIFGLVNLSISHFKESCYDIMRNGSGIVIGSCGVDNYVHFLKNQNNP
jgi:hypothetical protein